MNLQRFYRKCKACFHIIRANAQPSFSQAGEDIIIQYLFQLLKITRPTYLDIGANLPVNGSNTYFFYNKGSRGVCIEPDPELYQHLVKSRPGDKILNIGIGIQETAAADLYIFPHPYRGWNTFSKEEANKREGESGIKVQEIKSLQLLNVNDVIKNNFSSRPNFISLDVEGLDFDILKSLDFEKYGPEVICVETITFSTKLEEEKTQDIISFIVSKGYFIFADTHINTIFCKSEVYKLQSA
jgi:FkbM family methyltransferase